jgi:hypothetical protein
MGDRRTSPPDFSGAGPVDYVPAAAQVSGQAGRVLALEEARLLAIPGVVSVGIGDAAASEASIVVGVTDAGVAERLPPSLGGVAVTVTVTGPVDALPTR